MKKVFMTLGLFAALVSGSMSLLAGDCCDCCKGDQACCQDGCDNCACCKT